MKRITYWPQAVLGACVVISTIPHKSHNSVPRSLFYPPPPRNLFFLGLAFNWGALLGWSAVSGAVHWPVAGALYAGGVFWTLVYDSIYAHQDKADDVRVGIRSTALLFGEHTRSVLTAFSASSIGCIALAGYLNAHGAPFFIGTGLAAAQLARVIHRTDFDDRASCGRGFISCGFVGFWIWIGALGDYIWLQLRTDEEPCTDSVSQINS
jgi:4-hydroxybenzoate polyprenyltransferase